METEQSYNHLMVLRDYLCENLANTTLHQLNWPLTVSIVLGAALGLFYLHDRAPGQILYGKFNATSVLLDQEYTPRLSGYGLTVTSWPTTADIKLSFTMAHSKMNVWGFGIVLSELLTGRDSQEASSSLHCDKKSFVQWAAPFLQDEERLMLILNLRLKATKCPTNGALKLAALAVRCLKKKAAQLPSMARMEDCLKTLLPGCEGITRAAEQSSSSGVIAKRRATSTGGIFFHDAEHRAQSVGQYLSVQGANSAELDGGSRERALGTCG